MTFIADGDELVSDIKLYRNRHWSLHFYVLPFVALYSVWMHAWLIEDFYGQSTEAGLIVLAAIFILQALVVLCCHWSVHIMAFVTCSQVRRPEDASVAKVVPTANNGSAELVSIIHGRHGDIWCYFQKLKYVWDPNNGEFAGLTFPLDHDRLHYLDWKGFEDDQALSEAKRVFGDNGVDMTIPEFMELFKERATSPFFVFQVFCVGLWCLDEYIQYSLFTLVMLVMFECTLVNQQLRNMAEIRKMGNKPYPIQVYRNRRWRPIPSDQLVIGDIVSIGRSSNDNLVPCDLLLLRGPCIVDESMLTGEAVPQMKEALENVENNGCLNEQTDGRLHILYGGTKVVQHTPPSKTGSGLRAQDNGCIAYVLRTGFNTSQGKLLRTILYGVRRVTANNLETFGFIVFLLIFAIAAASYVWIKGTEDPNRNRYKLFLECTLILTSVVPPELPIELSLAVNSSLLQLYKLSVFCTEPFRIPFCGKVEICCFDKTGTLTSDHLVVEGVAGVNGNKEVVSIDQTPVESVQVLATCHSLVQLDDGIVGDPLEKATLDAIEWNLTKGEAVIPKKGRHPAMKIFHRHHFSSALKRMTVVAGYSQPGQSEINYIASVKGAPETLRSMFSSVPDNYDEVYLNLSRRGARVLALGRKDLGMLSYQQVRELSREQLEAGLQFVGFVIISCPLKHDSKAVIKELLHASHHVAMITGDNPLTACHVARELRFTRNRTTLIITRRAEDEWVWESVDQQVILPLSTGRSVAEKHDLCLTGDGLTYLQKAMPDELLKILPHVKVFARFDPKQKEHVITSLRALNYTVLMCGDGTNDVGALKHAHVGVAILSNIPESSKKKQAKPEEPAAEDAKPVKKIEDRLSKRPAGGRRGGPHNKEDQTRDRLSRQQAQMQKLLKEIEEAEQVPIVKLGDASIAAPFTSKNSSIMCINHVIKQGRCTLVTTLQMFKILALNALILAYSQSVLYLEGVKFSDGQATLQGLLLAACFLFISRSKPLKTLSKQRPLPNIFNAYTIFTVLSQFAVHFGCLLFLVNQAMLAEPRSAENPFPDLEKEFEPNLLNSTVYMISMTLQVATFAINYRGHPFMESMRENKALLYSLGATGSFIALLALGWVPELSEQFGIIDFKPEYRNMLLRVLSADFFLSLLVDRFCLMLFGEGRLPSPSL